MVHSSVRLSQKKEEEREREKRRKEREREIRRKTKRTLGSVLALPLDPPLATHDDEREMTMIGLASARTSANISICIMETV